MCGGRTAGARTGPCQRGWASARTQMRNPTTLAAISPASYSHAEREGVSRHSVEHPDKEAGRQVCQGVLA
eukprot:2213399-Rhodomonas_salina.2